MIILLQEHDLERILQAKKTNDIARSMPGTKATRQMLELEISLDCSNGGEKNPGITLGQKSVNKYV